MGKHANRQQIYECLNQQLFGEFIACFAIKVIAKVFKHLCNLFLFWMKGKFYDKEACLTHPIKNRRILRGKYSQSYTNSTINSTISLQSMMKCILNHKKYYTNI